jgi:hypothetical protein
VTIAVYELAPTEPIASTEDTTGLRVGSALEHATTHTANGCDLLLEQFQEKERIEALLSTVLDQVQEAEDAAWDLYTLRRYLVATGDLLDQLGDIVGEDRRDRTDDEYRRFVGVRILSNRSDGRIEDLNGILRAIWPDGEFAGFVRENYPAALVIQVENAIDATTPEAEIDAVFARSKAAGVTLSALYSHSAKADTMLPDSTVLQVSTATQRPGSTVSETGAPTASFHTV